MNLRPILFACTAAMAGAIATAAQAEPWTKVDELPGGIAVEIDENSQVEALDGVQLVEQATFRRQLPNGTLETAVAADCAHGTAKIRGVRLVNEGKVLSQNVNDKAPYKPVHQGSSEAIYFKALCGKEAPPPEPPADAATGKGGDQ
jgi:hypothetical protein